MGFISTVACTVYVGNVYVQFREEEHAANALRNLTERFYAGRPIIVDFSLVTDFLEATCRQYNNQLRQLLKNYRY
ncbi:hypothetical protein G4B88_027911 [Cannabis sativa]|uniref:RRM domain-containing protein n=1 Tax=Cannabis sativa TaxID=3483 RepID=A0A7J6I8Z6_CANSA|nr:hypothetical protein G4B88_027911 [Cannabis sativa]